MARDSAGYADAAPADAGAAWDTLVAGGCWIDSAQGPRAVVARAPLPSSEALERWQQPLAASPGLELVAFADRARRG